MGGEAGRVFRGTAERTEREIHINENLVSQPQDIQTLLEGTTSTCVLHFGQARYSPKEPPLVMHFLKLSYFSRTFLNILKEYHQHSTRELVEILDNRAVTSPPSRAVSHPSGETPAGLSNANFFSHFLLHGFLNSKISTQGTGRRLGWVK